MVSPTRYFRRLARRLRGHGFTREDAAILALGTFGTDNERTVLGVDFIATYDRSMIQLWSAQRTAIRKELAVMRRDLRPPYHLASSPEVLLPEQVPP